MFEVKIIADSISPAGKRLTTLTATYPRFIHSELMTHRAFARNAASSRAIPWKKTHEALCKNPVVPIVWGVEKSGMQTGDALPDRDAVFAAHIWNDACRDALHHADRLARMGVHKSLVNRLVEPFSWITTLITATEWENFYRLRCHTDAEIHFQKIAGMIRDARKASEPTYLTNAQWHLPFLSADELENIGFDFSGPATISGIEAARRISTARCARISYLTHEGTRDFMKDLELFDRLVQGSGFGHWSAHEHVATPAVKADQQSGPFVGWHQYRKHFAQENVSG